MELYFNINKAYGIVAVLIFFLSRKGLFCAVDYDFGQQYNCVILAILIITNFETVTGFITRNLRPLCSYRTVMTLGPQKYIPKAYIAGALQWIHF